MNNESFDEYLALFDLEGSWVEEVIAGPGVLTFKGEFVLTRDHPNFEWPPPPGSSLCTRRGVLSFERIRHLEWTFEGWPSTPNPDGVNDWGGFDEIRCDKATNTWVTIGDWGSMRFACMDGELVIL